MKSFIVILPSEDQLPVLAVDALDVEDVLLGMGFDSRTVAKASIVEVGQE